MKGSILIHEDDSILNFCITDTPMKYPTRLKLRFTKHTMVHAEFLYQMDMLCRCCLKSVRDLHQLHKNRITGMKIIDTIILRANPSYITVSHVIRMIWSVMSCIHHFQLRLRSGSTGLVHYSRKRTNKKCMKSYSKLIRMLDPRMHRIILNAILVFYNEGKLWEFEFACTDLIADLLSIYQNFEQVVTDILNIIEAVALHSVSEARHLVQILYEVFDKVSSYNLSEGFISRLLGMFESSISPKETDKFNYAPLRRSLQLCLRNLITNMSNKGLLALMTIILKDMRLLIKEDSILIDLGNIVSYAACKFRPKTFYRAFTNELYDAIIELTKTASPIVMPITERIWHNLLNRNNNIDIFSTPRIYLQDCDYKINLKECLRADKTFFKQHRHAIFELMLAIVNISQTKYSLENFFQSVALSITEIPCGYTASTYVAAALAVQDYAFQITNENLVKSHHLHAIVLSIMSLVCYVHKAEVFYEYVNSIMERRAEWAPHLNPPLKVEYEYAQHHILWNRPDLFFEDWETRYGLWKCFRVKTKIGET